jgi:uncharacterized protein YbjT (DUF2867 family)
MILVTGAAGNVGSQVARILTNDGVHVHAISRNPDSANLPAGISTTRGDFTDADVLARAADGADALFLMLPPAFVDLVPTVERAATRVPRIVFLSSALVRDGEPPKTPLAQQHAAVENALKRSGIEWTILRPGYFAANALRFWLPQLRRGDTLRFPLPNARFAAVHERDIAEIAALALTARGHNGSTYTLSGPELTTAAEMLAAIARSTGRNLRYEETTGDEALAAFGVPPEMARGILAGWAGTLTEPPFITDTVRRVLGKPARGFAEWAADHADAFMKSAA